MNAYKWPPKACPCGSNQYPECQENGCKWERDPSLVPASLRIPRGTVPAAVPADLKAELDRIEYLVANGQMQAAAVFTKMAQLVRAALATSAPPAAPTK